MIVTSTRRPGAPDECDERDERDEPGAEPDLDESSARRSEVAGIPRMLFLALVAAGIGIRIFILVGPLGRIDSDEAVAGLMVRHLSDDGFPPFFWGQHYGGTIELLPIAVSMKLFGSSVLALRVPSLVFTVLNAMLVTQVARRYLPLAQAQLAGLLMWIGPPAAVWFGVHEQMFYQPTVFFGLLLAVLAFRTREADRWIDYAGLGLVLGLSWWTSSNIVYYLPAMVVILVRRPEWKARWHVLVPRAAVAFVGACIGMAPWMIDNLHNDFAALRAGGAFPIHGTYSSRFVYFFTDGLPGELGFRETFTYHWIGGPLAVAAYLAVLVILAISLWKALRNLQWDGIGLVVFPFIFAFLPMVMDDPNLRYLFWIVPFLAVLVARLATTRRFTYLVLAATLLITGIGMQRLYAVSETQGPDNRIGKVVDIPLAIEVLDQQGITAAYADYWVAYRLDLESEERIIASPSGGSNRYESYTRFVEASPRSAWVVKMGGQNDAVCAALDRLGVAYQWFPAGDLAVVLPSRPVRPDELPESAR